MAKNGYDYEENIKNQAVKEQQELLMKMLALSCKLEREFRCVELASLMTQNAVNLAIKYASRSRKLILAQKLSDLAAEKAAESEEAQTEEEKEEDFRIKLNAGYSHTATEWSQPRARNQVEEDTEDREETVPEEKPEPHNHGQNLLQSANSPDMPALKSGAVFSSSQGRVNPFKVLVNSKEPAVSMSSTRSTNILDNMNKSSRKSTPLNRAANNEKSPVIKPLVPKPKSKQASAASYFQKRTPQADKPEEVKENPKNPSSETPAVCLQNSENQRPKTGFQMWLEENRSHILCDNPDLSDEADIIKEGMVRFRVLSAEERKAWTNKAKGEITSDGAEAKKRKLEVREAENQEEAAKENTDVSKKRKVSALPTSQRLSAFAFKQE